MYFFIASLMAAGIYASPASGSQPATQQKGRHVFDPGRMQSLLDGDPDTVTTS